MELQRREKWSMMVSTVAVQLRDQRALPLRRRPRPLHLEVVHGGLQRLIAVLDQRDRLDHHLPVLGDMNWSVATSGAETPIGVR